MITFNNIVERFEVFAENHFFIKSFSFGSPDDVDLAKFTDFPLLHMVYTGAAYDTGTKTYNIEVYILDVPADKSGKVERQKEVVSDAEQCAEDIIADIRMGGNIFTFAQDYEVVNATTTPLEEETKNVLSGVLLDLSVAIPYEWDACNAPIDGVSPEGGDEPSYARRGFLRMLTIDGTTDVLSVRTIKVNNGTLTDDGDGVVTLDTGGIDTLDDLTDVDINDPEQGDVLSYNAGVQKWMVNGGLQELLARFRASGTGAQMYDTLNDTTKGYIDVLANSAKMAVNLSGLTVTEASPGVMSFTVAAGTEGNEVEFEALTIEGSDALSTVAEINFKQGALTYWENSTGKIWLRAPNAGNITVLLPSSTGTLALTTDIPSVPVDSVNGQTGVVVLDTGDIDENGNLYFTDARVAANAAVAANTAKVGITPTQASEITANTAKTGITTQQAADITANNAKTGITPTQASEITANTAKVGVIAGGTSGQALVKASGTDYDLEWADIAIDTQYHDRFATDAETFRSGATDTVELYYTAKADGDGLAEDAESDTPTAGKVIKRKIYYSEAAFADPDTGTWVEFTTLADDITFANAKAALLEYLKARTGGTVPISLKQTWEEVTAAPSFTGLLNETYGSGAEAAYSTRRLNGLYSGDCMTIRRASDSTTQSIGFVGEEIDESAIETFCSGTSCTVQIWRDQSGNGNDAEQTTAANQPIIYTGGQLVKEGGRLALDFDGTNDYLDYAGLTETTLTSFHVAKPDQTNSGDAFLGWDGTTGSAFFRYNSDGTMRANFNGGFNTTTNYTASQNLVFCLFGTSLAIGYNGATAETGSATGLTSTGIRIGQKGNVDYFNGNAQEIVVYASDKSTDRTDIEGNISDYFQSAKLLDEQYGEGAEAAYSTRQLRRDQTDCMVIRRASDSTTTTIGFVDGDIDEAAIETFCTGTTCTVYCWKDQSGNGNDLTGGSGVEPTIYTGGEMVKNNGKASLSFAAGNYMSETGWDGASTSYIFNVLQSNGSESTPRIGIDVGSFTEYYGFGVNGNGGASSGGITSLAQTSNGTALAATRDAMWDAMQFQNVLSVSGDFSTWSGGFGLARSGISMYTFAQEFVIYNADKSSERTSIESNMGDYFTQNTPLLDTYSGAAAAYSLRRLSSSYTGDAVEVYNGSSYADIGFNVFGELDTVALAAHCGSSDGFVSKWYDQAGSNDATQTTTANMPKIYDGTTGVVTENGKPAVEFDGINDTMESSNFGSLIGAPNFFSAIVSFDDTDNQYIIDSDSPGRSATGIINGNYSIRGLNGGAAATGQHLISVSQESSNAYLYVDGNEKLSNASGTLVTHTNILISDNSLEFDGKYQELVLWDTDQSSNRSDIEDNINTFYSIY